MYRGADMNLQERTRILEDLGKTHDDRILAIAELRRLSAEGVDISFAFPVLAINDADKLRFLAELARSRQHDLSAIEEAMEVLAEDPALNIEDRSHGFNLRSLAREIRDAIDEQCGRLAPIKGLDLGSLEDFKLRAVSHRPRFADRIEVEFTNEGYTTATKLKSPWGNLPCGICGISDLSCIY
jgi:hypothetical protein